MSNGPQFFETRMGMKFYEGTMPRIAEALKDIAEALMAQPREARTRTVFPDAVAALFGECIELLHDHDTAWDNEEDSVKEEHAELMGRTRGFLASLKGAAHDPASLRARGLPVPVSLGLLDDIVNLVRHVAEDTRSEHVEEAELAKALLARIEKETR